MTEEFRCNDCDRNFGSSEAISSHNTAKQGVAKFSSVSDATKPFLTHKTIWVFGIILLVAGFWFANHLFDGTGNTVTGNYLSDKNNTRDNVGSNPSGDVQKITLGMKGNYYPNTIRVKSGIPVELTLDSTVQGCYRSFKIPDLGVSKYISPSDSIKFTPTQKGTFRFQCGMGMGTGTIIVE